jgi:hypothetical protein
VCIESLHSNCRGTDNSEPIIASLPSNDKQTLILLLLRAFRGFYGLNSYCMGETRNMLLSCPQNTGHNHDIKTANRAFENVSQFTYLGTTVTYQNFILEQIKRRLNSGNAYYHSVQTFCLLIWCLKKLKLEYTSYNFGCGFAWVWNMVWHWGKNKRVFENRALRRIFGLKRDDVIGGWRKLHEELQNLYSSPSIILAINSRMRLSRHVACMGAKPEGKRLLGRSRGVLEDILQCILER